MSELAELTPGVWNIDTSHTTVGFIARHLVVAKVRGRFGAVSGSLTVSDDPLDSTVSAEIEMASVDTGDSGRDEHLRSADFFDVEQFPTMSFTSTALRGDGAEYVLSGDLTIKGVARSIELDVEFDGVSPDPWGGTRVGFTAEGEINRRDYGLDFDVKLDTGGALVSEKIKIVLDVEAVLAVPAVLA
jgi:polyisoprenoid-binding protein YceI